MDAPLDLQWAGHLAVPMVVVRVEPKAAKKVVVKAGL